MCPDITMCKDKDCPYKDKCYRFVSKPNSYQSYFIDSPRGEYQCEYLIEV